MLRATNVERQSWEYVVLRVGTREKIEKNIDSFYFTI